MILEKVHPRSQGIGEQKVTVRRQDCKWRFYLLKRSKQLLLPELRGCRPGCNVDVQQLAKVLFIVIACTPLIIRVTYPQQDNRYVVQ
ncbi:hypothetical protein D3C84_774030 [compost metagenome]